MIDTYFLYFCAHTRTPGATKVTAANAAITSPVAVRDTEAAAVTAHRHSASVTDV